MPNMLEDGVASMMTTFLAKAGSACIYSRDVTVNIVASIPPFVLTGGKSAPVTMHKRPQPPLVIEIDGFVTEILLTDFLTDPHLLPYGLPIQGDLIQVDGELYTVQPADEGTKCFKQAANSMIRIHTKKVNNGTGFGS